MLSDIDRVPFDNIANLVQRNLRKMTPERVPCLSAAGRFVLEDVFATKPIPEYDVSEKDGFAVSSRALTGAAPSSPVRLTILGIINPGQRRIPRVVDGTCVKILTGARLPSGSDSVVMQEDTIVEDGRAIFTRTVRSGANIFRKGSDIKKGELLFPASHRLSNEDVTLVSEAGVNHVTVAPKVSVGVMATGSELVENPEHLSAGGILESNRTVLMNHLSREGFEAKDAGLAKDEIQDISRSLGRALEKFDAVVTTGGSSVGKADLVSEALHDLGARRIFHGVKLRPSSTAGVSVYLSKPIFVLSGLMQSSLVALYSIVIPSLRMMQGLNPKIHRTLEARLSSDFKIDGDSSFKRAVWVRLKSIDATIYAEPFRASSHSRSVAARCHGFFIADAGTTVREGNIVQVVVVREHLT